VSRTRWAMQWPSITTVPRQGTLEHRSFILSPKVRAAGPRRAQDWRAAARLPVSREYRTPRNGPLRARTNALQPTLRWASTVRC
jgi:hypothetical protein